MSSYIIANPPACHDSGVFSVTISRGPSLAPGLVHVIPLSRSMWD